jgi:hypothetical protein
MTPKIKKTIHDGLLVANTVITSRIYRCVLAIPLPYRKKLHTSDTQPRVVDVVHPQLTSI